MLYFIIEKNQCSATVWDRQGSIISVPAFMTCDMPTGEQFIPVFLSVFHARVYLRSVGPESEFEMVQMDSESICRYRELANFINPEVDPFIFNGRFRAVYGVHETDNKYGLVLLNNDFTLKQVFLAEDDIHHFMIAAIGPDHYKTLTLLNDKGEDELEKAVKGMMSLLVQRSPRDPLYFLEKMRAKFNKKRYVRDVQGSVRLPTMIPGEKTLQ